MVRIKSWLTTWWCWTLLPAWPWSLCFVSRFRGEFSTIRLSASLLVFSEQSSYASTGSTQSSWFSTESSWSVTLISVVTSGRRRFDRCCWWPRSSFQWFTPASSLFTRRKQGFKSKVDLQYFNLSSEVTWFAERRRNTWDLISRISTRRMITTMMETCTTCPGIIPTRSGSTVSVLSF